MDQMVTPLRGQVTTPRVEDVCPPASLRSVDQRRTGLSKSLFGKVHTPPTSRLNIRRIVATSMRVSLVCTIRS